MLAEDDRRSLGRRPVVRLLVVLALVGSGATALITANASTAADEPALVPVPRAHCGPGARPETDIQGRVPTSDYESGRAARGYRCNTRPIGHLGHDGGFKVWRYVDDTGHVCAFYDSAVMVSPDAPYNTGSVGAGTTVLDMSRAKRPVRTTTLSTPAMDSPHESLYLSKRRGLLLAVAGNIETLPGQIDIYDVATSCRQPALLSSTPSGLLGHESGLSPDGKTFYTASTFAQTFAAIDISDPTLPVPLLEKAGVNWHGLRLSRDGRTLYAARIGTQTELNYADGGLDVYDVSEIQDRVLNPSVTELTPLEWRSASIPQAADPFRAHGRRYLLEVDEFANFGFTSGGEFDPDVLAGSPVGAARIIDVTRRRAPFLVSNVRLEVHQAKTRSGPEMQDPGASSPLQGYAAHYCSVPRYKNPKLAACSMINSGLRIFDIRNPTHPREVAYFNKPLAPGERQNKEGASAFSAPAWDLARRQIWYTDGHTGFWALRLTNGVVPRSYRR